MRLGLEYLGVMLIRIVIALGAISIAAPEMAFAVQIQKDDHWANTGLNDSHLKKFLSQEKCYSSETSFLGCIDAINSILASGAPKKILSNKNIESLAKMGDVVVALERLKIQLLKSSTEAHSAMDAAKIATDERKIITQSWRTVYQLTKESPLSIEKILDKSLGFTQQTLRSATLAYAINEYYRTVIDPHTHIVPISERKKKHSTSESVTIGIGVRLVKSQGNFYLKPKTGSPAFYSGIKPMDILLQVDNTNVEGLELDDVVNKITGDENTSVKITVSRDGKNISFDTLRTRFAEKNLSIQILNDPINKTKIGYIKINYFTETGVCKKFVEHAVALRSQNATSLILDLRDNLGGLVDEGECIASTYLKQGTIVFTENDPATNKIKTTHYARKITSIYDLFGRKPLTILVNASSASASEIISGSLRTYSRAIIVGERTFGKGTIQLEQTWKPEGLDAPAGITLMKTIARFHFANGESNQLVGIAPDIEAHIKKYPSAEDLFAIREADRYLNAVSAASFAPYKPTAKVHAIEACIEQRNTVDAEHSYKVNAHLVPDRQLAIAREAASCL